MSDFCAAMSVPVKPGSPAAVWIVAYSCGGKVHLQKGTAPTAAASAKAAHKAVRKLKPAAVAVPKRSGELRKLLRESGMKVRSLTHSGPDKDVQLALHEVTRKAAATPATKAPAPSPAKPVAPQPTPPKPQSLTPLRNPRAHFVAEPLTTLEHEIATDASFRVGCAFATSAFVTANGSFGTEVEHNCATIHDAELRAIIRALQFVADHRAPRALIYSDSKHALEAIEQFLQGAPLSTTARVVSASAVRDFGQAYAAAAELTAISFSHVKGHSTNQLNNLADKLAGYTRTAATAADKQAMEKFETNVTTLMGDYLFRNAFNWKMPSHSAIRSAT